VNGEDGRKIYSDRPSLAQLQAAGGRLTRGNVVFAIDEKSGGISMHSKEHSGVDKDILILKVHRKALKWHEPPVRLFKLRWLVDHPPAFAIVGTRERYQATPSHSAYPFES